MLFKHAEIFTPQGFVRGAFTVEDGRFGEILPQSPDMPGTDLGGARVIPGLIDIHNHGNSGADFSDGDPDGIRTMARYLAKNGVTSFAPASMTLPYDVLARAFCAAADYNRAAHPGCARLMGIQMEGPFFSEKKKGAQNGAYLREPDFDVFKRLYDASEGLIRIADVAAELALSRPEIAVRFVNNGKVVFQTVGNGDLRSAIYVLHGREVASEALPFSYAQGAVRASGFVGVGNLARSNRSYELFFVNGRFVRDSVLSGAVEAACHERVMIGKYPYCVLNLSIPAEAVDVNVHPNKLAVRFKEDFPVREHVQAAVEAAFADGAAPLRAVAPSAPDAPPPEVPPPADADAPPPPEQIAMALCQEK